LGIIEVEDLWYSYPNSSKHVLRDVNLKIESGEFILLTGPSGCGKTTFCRCLNGLIPKFYRGDLKGSLIVSGLDTKDTSTSNLAKEVGLIFQNPDNQIFALTVEKDVAFGLENMGIPKVEMLKEIDWATKTTGIDNLRQRATHELSGGQKQRLTIASILAMHPRILIMDEPTAFLDPVGAEKIFGVLDDLNKSLGMTIILVEHRMDLAAKYVDRIILFNEGEVVNDGSPSKVFFDDQTRLLGVGIPRVFELARLLRNRGIYFLDLPTSAIQFYDMLRDYLPSVSQINVDQCNEFDNFAGEYSHQPAIEVQNVSFSYPGGVKALNDLSLTIFHGDFVAIMGENGAGKTTLVKHFNGLLRPNIGSVFFNGNNVKESSVASLSKNIGLVFQNPDDQLFEENVENELAFALKNFGFNEKVITQRIDWALNLLGLEEYRSTSPFILSGGERKRVALASVLAWDPSILVLDEPTVGQDYGQKERLRHFLIHLRAQGKTVVIVTHDVEFVAECQPRIVLMSQGKVVADGSAKQIMTSVNDLRKCSVAQPEITRLFGKLHRHGFPKDVLEVNEAFDYLHNRLEVLK
jgi:energy-coupling factor transport system ATP-binding protein